VTKKSHEQINLSLYVACSTVQYLVPGAGSTRTGKTKDSNESRTMWDEMQHKMRCCRWQPSMRRCQGWDRTLPGKDLVYTGVHIGIIDYIVDTEFN
jgi:hypothetical protein